MKHSASFLKRFLAQVIDIFVVSLIIGVVTMGFDTDRIDKLSVEANNVMNSYLDGDVGVEDYVLDYVDIMYDINRAQFGSNLMYLLVCVGYFLIFQFLNGGQTLGKKLLKIRVVGKDGGKLSFIQMFVRCSVVNEIVPMAMILLLIFVSTGMTFFVIYSIIGFVLNLFVIICAFMILYRKDRLGLHDIMSRSVVVDEGLIDNKL